MRGAAGNTGRMTPLHLWAALLMVEWDPALKSEGSLGTLPNGMFPEPILVK